MPSGAGLVVLALVCQSAYAGDVEVSHATDKGGVLVAAMASSAGIKPSVRVFPVGNFGFGGGFCVSGAASLRASSDSTSTTGILSLEPGATYFFGGPGSTLLPYADCCVTLGVRQNGYGQRAVYTSVDPGIRLAVGLCPPVGKHGAAMAEVGCIFSMYSDRYGEGGTSKGSSVQLYLAAGFGGFIF